MKKIVGFHRNQNRHWVGNGFPVRSLFSYHGDTATINPFLLFDYAGPHIFSPHEGSPRGVGQHPHRGFETVTIVYEGEVSHSDSTGGGGTIGPGDVQWMTAAGGIIHEEYHSEAFSKSGGAFRMVQLWVNLPSKDKMKPARYQAITTDEIPVVTFDFGKTRVIAGSFQGTEGAASTFSPINLWDVRLTKGADITLNLPEGHNAMIAVLSGRLSIDGQAVSEAEIAQFSIDGAGAQVAAEEDTMLLVMTGEPIDEPVFGHGPFVMNTRAEIETAMDDFNAGRFEHAPV